jgi:hypothetical protein
MTQRRKKHEPPRRPCLDALGDNREQAIKEVIAAAFEKLSIKDQDTLNALVEQVGIPGFGIGSILRFLLVVENRARLAQLDAVAQADNGN